MTDTATTGPVAQPFLHDLVTCVSAPTTALSGQDGQIRHTGAHGVFRHDVRVLSMLMADVDGQEPVPVGHGPDAADTARFVAVIRHLGDPGADPTVTLERHRRVTADGLDERLTLTNASRRTVTASVTVRATADFAPMDAVKHGAHHPPVPGETLSRAGAVWTGAHARTDVRATGEPEVTIGEDGLARLVWRVGVPSRTSWTATVTVTSTSLGPDSSGRFSPAADVLGGGPAAESAAPDLSRLVARGVADVAALTLADPAQPADVFAAAGSPWFLTLFGRDSLWTARLALPAGTDLARGTLHALARRQGTRHDRHTGEAPGKIPHEVRTPGADLRGLPPVYFGTVDATALWVCLLHDAWRWGLADEEVTALLDALEAALAWLVEHADADGDGLLEYVDHSGRGLANQGWKDSGDAIQFPDGTIAQPPIVLSEAQGYAHEAATRGAALLDAFGRPGAARLRAWAATLRERFRELFWVDDARGRFPAVALDRHKRPVATATSNLGHLLGTGLLEPAEVAAVADRLGAPDLDCGYGLRTMTSDAAGFNPLGYHTGSVWPHDTAIAVRGLAREGHAEAAASLATGLLRAAPAFAHRLPELFAGTDGRAGSPVLAYPAACRPQAWSAAAPVALLATALGLDADVPRGWAWLAPPEAFARWFPLRVSGLRVAGHPLTVTVDADGHTEHQSTAPLRFDATAPVPGQRKSDLGRPSPSVGPEPTKIHRSGQ
jgi:glycogen debranching enzyme